MIRDINFNKRFIYLNGTPEGPSEAKPLPSGDEKAEPMPVSPQEQSDTTKMLGTEVAGNAFAAVDAQHIDQPFTAEELEAKSKGYPEIKTNNNTYKEMKQYFPQIKQQIIDDFNKHKPADVAKKTQVEHGDTGSIFIDFGEGENEYVLVFDKTSNPKERLFGV